MSDKGYGDCSNRNVVKNPLLSTAVTGLSVEDLTHNAVLLPAVPSQELITRQDEQNVYQQVTLGHSDQDITNFPSGDAAYTSPQPKQPSININQFEHQKQSQNVNIKENYTTSKSKNDDDFDVNEYFARLQGTRYVSAPINSNLKEDQNANLQAEENLEEINLNEPDKTQVQEDFQNSLTADIAQNFSQLPTVLPQVASAVFSSFSNMLSLKNKEQISDDCKNYQHAQLQDMTVSPPGSEPLAPSAPPLMEPPITSNTSSYRITTKKKVYAQIPGIISSDNNVHTFNLPAVGQTTSYFTPDMSFKDRKEENVAEVEIIDRKEEAYDMFNKNALQTEKFSQSVMTDQQQGMNVNVFHQEMPSQQQENIYNQSQKTASSHTEASGQTKEINMQDNLQDTLNSSFNKFIPISQEPSAIIPPPPMFSSLPRRDSQSSGKSVLPPSVARRIGAHQPVIKNQTSNIPLPDNIFIPTISNIGPSDASKEPQTNLTQYPQQDSIYNPPIVQTNDSGVSNPYIQTIGSFPSQDAVNSSLFTQPTNTVEVPLRQNSSIESKVASEDKKLSNVFSPYSDAAKPVNIVNQNVNQPEKTEQALPPLFFSPANMSQTFNSQPQESQTGSIAQSILSQFHSTATVPEPPKAIPEPPKVSGNLNYRMTKKRPQYYSGPIEGFGSISNNIKPTIQPVETNAFSGSLFQNDPMQSVPPLSVDYNAPVMQNPSYDMNSSINLVGQSAVDPYLPQGKPHQQIDYNTAFDLSRPTTESYEQPPPSEPKGFGIIGSLKSKLSSIDINKIQNTVTTFFDPAYNESKIDQNNATESSFHSISGNYQNFPQHESAALEVFVPNIENQYQQSNPYNYQLQTHQLYNNQQYYPKQEYFHPPQGYSNDFYSNYPSNTNLSTTDAYMPATPFNNDNTQSTNVQPLMDTTLLSHEFVQPDRNPQEKEKQVAIDNTQLVETAKSALDEFGITDDVEQSKNVNNLNPLKINEECDVVEGIPVTDSFENNYDFPDKVIQPPQKLCKDIKPKDDKTSTSNTDIIKELQSVADSTLKKVFDCQTPVVVESALENDNNITLAAPKATVDPLKSFFDYPHSICPLATSKKDNIELTDCNLLANDSLKCFFDSPAPTTSHGLELKNEFMIQNTQSVINTGHAMQGISESADFKGLSTVLKTKSENLQAPAPSTVQNTLNETPLFSLFDQPQLLPPVPSFDLSKISSSSLPVSNNETSAIQNIENKMDNISLYDNVDNMVKFERRSSFFDKTMPIENDKKQLDSQPTDLKICETSRVFSKPDDKEADLTTQLIENITAPIQLANPVDFPTAVGVAVVTTVPDISNFSNQFAEISHIPEDIIETMKQPPSVELKDNFPAAINFGWSVGETNPSIGFYGDNSLFFENVPANASDEIKAEYKISQDDAVVLPRQLSIPTAPPEEDNNSDESGLDVHSIEQDAKKDFPIYEEFVIEPSETDDDKIEYKEREKLTEETPQEVDTFTNRVERFKQMETSTDVIEDSELQKTVKPITLATSTSPAVTIASYFDTGNYAVENHYKNSLTSPTAIAFNANINLTSTIPPGFEDEFNKNLAGISSMEPPVDYKIGNIIHVPETSTQTSLTISQTFSQASSAPLNVVTTQIVTISSFVQETATTKTDRLPAFSSIIEPKSEISDDVPSVFDKQTEETTPAANTLSESSNLFSSTETSSNADVYSNFSRLSSYFSSPPQPDHSKSFFELSQSQNHYRHKPEHFDTIQSNVKNFFQSDPNKVTNIPQNSSNMNLVRDLASYKRFTPNDVVKTVNYFTVEYDIDTIKVGEPKSSIDLNEKHIETDYDQPNELGNTDGASLNIVDIIKNCKYCCDTIKIDLNCNYSKLRTCMDTSDTKKGDANMETKKDDIKKSVTINFCDPSYNDTNESVVVSSENRSSSEYSPVKHHWFYRVDCEGKSIWRGFSVADSRALENAFISPDLNENTVVATDGGRFDVNVVGRLRIPVYWSEKPTNVMRCSWFYKGNIDARYVPYAESVAEKLEEEYHHGVTTGEWHRRLMLPNNEMVVMHGPAVMVHFLQTSPTDAFSSTPLFTFGKRVYRNPPKIKVAGDQLNKIDHLIFLVHGAGEYRNQKEKIQSTMRPRVVRRGCVESEIEDTEPSSIDHLLLLCHGVGSACDMRFRSVEEVVDDFRTTSLQLIQSHYKNSYDSGIIGRVEVLPISWHSSLHSGETGVDRRLAAVTLESIPRLRNFTNDTILDVLFYTSPVYCQTIVDTVCSELNRIYKLFKSRNPDFKGGVSLGGHSLGSVILYDLLCHQTAKELESNSSKQYVQGCAGTGQPSVKYPRLVFYPDALYALGSPIAIFECIRGVETLGKDFCLPTCKNFFNIFHPYDPIAYRLEPMINPSLRNVKPYLIPHHKGRKRMHLELKDTMARVGADIKQKLIESIRNTWTSMWRKETGQVEVVQEDPEKEELTSDAKEENNQYEATPDELGHLNGGRRVDHVLQEAPFEIFNEYLFAMTSHVCYWESEDTMLVMLREIYNALGVTPDCSLPQNTMTVERSRLTEDQDVKSDMSPEFPSTSRGSM